MKNFSTFIQIIFLMGVLFAPHFGHAEQANGDPNKIHDALELLSSGGGDLNSLTVIYDDLHGLWGGLTLKIYGNGKVEQNAVHIKAGETKTVSAQELKQLVDILHEQKVWEQRISERPAMLDEGRAKLTISYAGDSFTIWEWFNDMKTNQRIVKIRDIMEQIAWTKSSK